MSSMLCEKLMKPGPLQRGIAIFFLFFTFVDLIVLDLMGQRRCIEGFESASMVGSMLTPDENFQDDQSYRVALVRAATDDQPTLPADESSEAGHDEDCFCCCSHLLHSVSLVADSLNIPAKAADPALPFIPSPSPHGTYRPPRLA